MGLHVAVIMDGNGRWARERGLSREEGHKAGATAVRGAVEFAAAAKIEWLTLFAFSSDNWHRPPAEVSSLLVLFAAYLREQTPSCVKHGIRLSLLGRRDRLGSSLRREVERAEQETRAGDGLRLRLAIDYSGRAAILRAARRCQAPGTVSAEMFARLLAGYGPSVESPPGESDLAVWPPQSRGRGPALCGSVQAVPETADATAPNAVENAPGVVPESRDVLPAEVVPDVDLLIRTGGEKRLSDFLLWESAWAELVFLDTMWPDFGATEFEEALREFRGRNRRFGRVPDDAGTVGERPASAAL